MTFRKFDIGATTRPKGVTNDCQVRALALASAVGWESAWRELYERQGIRKACHFILIESLKEMANKTHSPGSMNYIGFYGFDVTQELSFPAKKSQKRTTVESFCKKYKKGRFILQVANHVVAVRDGEFFDTGDCSHSCVYKAWEIEIRRSQPTKPLSAQLDNEGYPDPRVSDDEGEM